MSNQHSSRKVDKARGDDGCPHSARVERTERVVEILTRDVDKLVKSQQDLVELHKQWAVQTVENKHTSETIARMFRRIDQNDQSIVAVRSELAEIRSKASMLMLIMRNWPLIIGVAAAMYGGMVMLKQSGLGTWLGSG